MKLSILLVFVLLLATLSMAMPGPTDPPILPSSLIGHTAPPTKIDLEHTSIMSVYAINNQNPMLPPYIPMIMPNLGRFTDDQGVGYNIIQGLFGDSRVNKIAISNNGIPQSLYDYYNETPPPISSFGDTNAKPETVWPHPGYTQLGNISNKSSNIVGNAGGMPPIM